MCLCLHDTNELAKHKIWDCIQAQRAWQWVTFIMHEVCGVRTGNYDSFHWKQTLFGERIPEKFAKIIKIQHLLRGVTLWVVWIKRNDGVFNHEECHESKVEHLIKMTSLCTPRWLGKECLSLSRLMPSQPKLSIKVLTKPRVLGTSFIGETI